MSVAIEEGKWFHHQSTNEFAFISFAQIFACSPLDREE